jgi:hypothetical protein
MLGKVSLRSVALVAVCSLLCAEASAGLVGIIGNLNIGGGANPLAQVEFEGPDSIILTASNFNVVTAQVASGYNWGAWDGLGIVSKPARLNPLANTAIGVLKGEDYWYGTFYGQNVQPSWILVHYTYAGDATLDSVVDLDDYAQIDWAYVNPSMPRIWINGDFNYDGNIDLDDYGAIDWGFATQGMEPVQYRPGSGVGVLAGEAAAPVPEPATLVMLGCAAGVAAAFCRRRIVCG